MPETKTPPADGTTGDEGKTPEGTPPTGTPPAGGAQAPAGGTTPPKTFTQEELDAIVTARLSREKPDPEILRKAAEFDKLEEANKTELEKAQSAADRAKEEAKAANARADRILVNAAIMAEASAANAADVDTVLALLSGSPDITIEGETVKGAKAAVAKLLKDKPFLAKTTTPGASGGEFGGVDKSTLDEQIRQAEAKGDWTLSRRLKLAKIGRG